MKYLKHILFSFLLLFSGFVFSQNKLITSGSNFIAVGDNLLSTPFNQYSLNFDGVDEFTNIDGALIPLFSTEVGTWSCWIKPVDATPTGSEMILTFNGTDANEFIQMARSTTGKINVTARIAGLNKWIINTDNAVFSDNTWTHIALVKDVTPLLYIDGVEVAQTLSGADQTVWFNDLTALDNGRIADRKFNGGAESIFFTGNIDEVSFWKKAFSQDEINEKYNSGIPTNLRYHSAAIDLVGWFRMGDGDTFNTDWTLKDNSINSNTGTSVNMEFLDRTHAKP